MTDRITGFLLKIDWNSESQVRVIKAKHCYFYPKSNTMSARPLTSKGEYSHFWRKAKFKTTITALHHSRRMKAFSAFGLGRSLTLNNCFLFSINSFKLKAACIFIHRSMGEWLCRPWRCHRSRWADDRMHWAWNLWLNSTMPVAVSIGGHLASPVKECTVQTNKQTNGKKYKCPGTHAHYSIHVHKLCKKWPEYKNTIYFFQTHCLTDFFPSIFRNNFLYNFLSLRPATTPGVCEKRTPTAGASCVRPVVRDGTCI